MTTKIEDTIKSLIGEGRKAGFLTVTGMTKLMEDQFVNEQNVFSTARTR